MFVMFYFLIGVVRTGCLFMFKNKQLKDINVLSSYKKKKKRFS